MSIPIDPISIDLTKDTPSPLTADVLGKQLNNMGLDCKFTKPRLLNGIIAEAKGQLPPGTLESFRLLRPTDDASTTIESLVDNYKISSKGNWSIEDTKYDPILTYILYPTHFDWLKTTYPGTFTGISEETKPDPLKATTVDAIKKFFVDTLTMASSAVLKGINHSTLESMLTNVFDTTVPPDIKNYNKSDSRVIFLVDSYDPNTKSADAIGAVAINWTLQIKDYKKKSNTPLLHDTHLSVSARGIMYADLDQMNADFNNAKKHFNTSNVLQLDIPLPSSNELKIFDKQPPKGQETFDKGLPLISKAEYLDRIILFAPDLQAVASIDNSSSSDSASYLKSVSTGFKFGMSQNISITAGFEVSVEVVKASFSTTFSFGFSEEWSKLTTETINFTVPPGKKGFLYQGTVVSRILRYTPAHNSYVYLDMGELKTTVFAIRDEPIAAGAQVQLRDVN